MATGHWILALSLIWGMLLQQILSVFSFEWATLFFVAFNLSVPFAVLLNNMGNKLDFIQIERLSFNALLEIIILIAFTFPVIQLIGGWVSGFLPDPNTGGIITAALPLWLAFVVVAPVVEELFFRGYLLKQYKDKGIVRGSVWVALWFALYHLNGKQAVYTFVLALVLNGLMNRKNNLLMPILVHCGINALSFWVGTGGYMLLESKAFFLQTVVSILSPASWAPAFSLFYLLAYGFVINLIYYKVPRQNSHRSGRRLRLDTPLILVIVFFIVSIVSHHQ